MGCYGVGMGWPLAAMGWLWGRYGVWEGAAYGAALGCAMGHIGGGYGATPQHHGAAPHPTP